MQTVHMALVQHRWTGQRDTMKALVRELIETAAERGAQLVGLPEFSISPYFAGTRDKAGFQWAESLTDGESVRFFNTMARQFNVTIIGSLFEVTPAGDYYDTATVHAPSGELTHFTRKVHIPSGEGYHETDFFKGSDEFPVHALEHVKLAAPTCYDQWFPELARIYALKGAELIFYPTAIGSEPTDPDFDSASTWQTVMRGHAVANGLFIGAANRVGTENAVTFYGSSFICDPTGKVIAQAGRDKPEVIDAVLDVTVRDRYLQLFPLLHQRRPTTYQLILEKYAQPPAERWRGEAGFED